MHRGYVHLWRKTEESVVWERGPLHFQIWTHLLMKATGTGCTLPDGTILKRGQLKTSYGTIQKALRYRYGRGYGVPALTTVKKSVSCLFHDQMIDLFPDQTGLLITICNYEQYNPHKKESCPVEEPVEKGFRIGHESTLKKEYKEGSKEVLQKLSSFDSSNDSSKDSGQAALPPPDSPVSEAEDNGRAKAVSADIQTIAAYYQSKIHPRARLIVGAKNKIRVRLNTYSKDDLIRAIDLFASDAWWMEHNARQGMAWFFRSDEQIERFLGIVPRQAEPKPDPKPTQTYNPSPVSYCPKCNQYTWKCECGFIKH